MITSNKQYAAAQEQLTMLTASLSSRKKKGVPDLIKKANKMQLQELIREIQINMEEYTR